VVTDPAVRAPRRPPFATGNLPETDPPTVPPSPDDGTSAPQPGTIVTMR